MSDIIDVANDIAEYTLAISLQNRVKPLPTLNTLCEDCDTEIGTARKAAVPHATKCVECQGIHERHL